MLRLDDQRVIKNDAKEIQQEDDPQPRARRLAEDVATREVVKAKTEHEEEGYRRETAHEIEQDSERWDRSLDTFEPILYRANIREPKDDERDDIVRHQESEHYELRRREEAAGRIAARGPAIPRRTLDNGPLHRLLN